eukprot:105162-Prymnesium_polylepis.1
MLRVARHRKITKTTLIPCAAPKLRVESANGKEKRKAKGRASGREKKILLFVKKRKKGFNAARIGRRETESVPNPTPRRSLQPEGHTTTQRHRSQRSAVGVVCRLPPHARATMRLPRRATGCRVARIWQFANMQRARASRSRLVVAKQLTRVRSSVLLLRLEPDVLLRIAAVAHTRGIRALAEHRAEVSRSNAYAAAVDHALNDPALAVGDPFDEEAARAVELRLGLQAVHLDQLADVRSQHRLVAPRWDCFGWRVRCCGGMGAAA